MLITAYKQVIAKESATDNWLAKYLTFHMKQHLLQCQIDLFVTNTNVVCTKNNLTFHK